ncbi:glycosyltransferase [Halopenitus persicus]|uniref:glycosyltransferase n=1 Tax=Halopenitus persicus TaxID=1048396 RepID=UPI000BBAE6AE|nr:glycosyltransferase [Halopenitus persicus]
MSTSSSEGPTVSYVIPTDEEADYLDATLERIRLQSTAEPIEVIVADADSSDGTRSIARDHGVRLLTGATDGIWEGRNRGGAVAEGDWIAFVDADTLVAPNHCDRLLAYAREHDLDAASSRCRVPGLRATCMEAVINHVFPRLRRPILPGFNVLIRRDVFTATGGFPAVPNEDTAYSRRLGRTHRTGYCPDVLVETSPRRIERDGLTGTAIHYLRLDRERLRSA